MIPSKIWLAVGVLGLAACGDEPAPRSPEISQALPNIPLPPDAKLVQRSGGAEAVQLTLTTPNKAADVERYYRGVLSRGRWKLIKDYRDPAGGVVLLAEQEGPPLWVRIWSTDDSMATMVELAGAVVPPDTTKKPDTTRKPAKPAG